MNEFEKKIVLIFNSNRSKFVDALSGSISSVPLLVLIWVVIAGFVLYIDLFNGIFVCLGLAIVFILHFIVSEGILKYGGKLCKLQRVRPYIEYPNEIKSVGKKFSDSSFPSSHVASMVGGLVVLVYFYESLWLVAIILTLLISWSRLRNGMHYPSDILAGVALGLAYGYIALAILKIM
jgi:undecaprenyl-diphosphatase